MDQVTETFNRAMRAAAGVACFMLAVFLVYRGNVETDPHHAMLVPVMCVLTALVLCATGLAVMLRAMNGREMEQSGF